MNVTTIPLPPIMTNCYVAYEREGGKCFIIDPASNEEQIIRLIKSKGLIPSAILLTHGHFDHIGAADKLREYYSIPLYVHKDDGEMIRSHHANCSMAFTGTSVELSQADRLLKDGDVIKLDDEELFVMHTPGHSPGSCVFVGNDLIFSGDTVFKGTYGRYDLPGGDFQALFRSIQKVMALNPTMTVYPGHNEETSIGEERKYYL